MSADTKPESAPEGPQIFPEGQRTTGSSAVLTEELRHALSARVQFPTK